MTRAILVLERLALAEYTRTQPKILKIATIGNQLQLPVKTNYQLLF